MAFGMPEAQGRKGKNWNQTVAAAYNVNGCQDNEISLCIPRFARKHQWTNCISRYWKVSLLLVPYIAFHGLEPLSRQKNPDMKNSSPTFLPISQVKKEEKQGDTAEKNNKEMTQWRKIGNYLQSIGIQREMWGIWACFTYFPGIFPNLIKKQKQKNWW